MEQCSAAASYGLVFNINQASFFYGAEPVETTYLPQRLRVLFEYATRINRSPTNRSAEVKCSIGFCNV